MRVSLLHLQKAINNLVENVSDTSERYAAITLLEEPRFQPFAGMPPQIPMMADSRHFTLQAERHGRGAPWTIELDFAGVAEKALSDRREADHIIVALRDKVRQLETTNEMLNIAYSAPIQNSSKRHGRRSTDK